MSGIQVIITFGEAESFAWKGFHTCDLLQWKLSASASLSAGGAQRTRRKERAKEEKEEHRQHSCKANVFSIITEAIVKQ